VEISSEVRKICCQKRLSSYFVFLGQRLIFVGCLMIMLDALGCGGLWCSGAGCDAYCWCRAPTLLTWMSKLGVVVMHLYNPVFLHLIPEHCHILLYLTHPNDILLPLHFRHSNVTAHLQGVSTTIALALHSSIQLSLHWNTATYIVVYTQCHLSRQESSSVPLWEPQVSVNFILGVECEIYWSLHTCTPFAGMWNSSLWMS
jgi:hypothetical protein